MPLLWVTERDLRIDSSMKSKAVCFSRHQKPWQHSSGDTVGVAELREAWGLLTGTKRSKDSRHVICSASMQWKIHQDPKSQFWLRVEFPIGLPVRNGTCNTFNLKLLMPSNIPLLILFTTHSYSFASPVIGHEDLQRHAKGGSCLAMRHTTPSDQLDQNFKGSSTERICCEKSTWESWICGAIQAIEAKLKHLGTSIQATCRFMPESTLKLEQTNFYLAGCKWGVHQAWNSFTSRGG